MTLLLAIILLTNTADDTKSTVGPALVAAHNRERTEKKLPPLVSNPLLTEAARLHAIDMASHATMSHDGSDGSKPAERVKKAGYVYVTTGENVAKGQPTVDSVMKAWMNSPHHRENILGDAFTEIGVARALDDDGVPYWCVEFGRPIPKLDPPKAEAELADLINKARADADKPPLRLDPKLAETARLLARDMASKGSEKAKSTPSFADRMKASGYRYSTVAESGSTGAPTAESVVKSLMDSEQKKAILGDFSDLGVGYVTGDDGRPTWCLLLAKPLKP